MDPYHNSRPESTTSLFQMNVDAQNSYHLRSSASWARVLGVAGMLVGAAIILWMGIVLAYNEGSSGGYRYRRGQFGEVFDRGDPVTGSVIMMIIGLIFIFGGVLSLRFGNKIITALKSNDQNGLNTAFAALRNYFALRSIAMIIVLVILFLVLSSAT